MEKIINKGRNEVAKDIVYKYLRNRKYIILEKNFKYKKDKVDLIVYDELTKELVFINIKIYSKIRDMDNKKIVEDENTLKAMAKHYNYEYGLYDIAVRFDMIKIFLNNSVYKIKHIKKLFKINMNNYSY